MKIFFKFKLLDKKNIKFFIIKIFNFIVFNFHFVVLNIKKYLEV